MINAGITVNVALDDFGGDDFRCLRTFLASEAIDVIVLIQSIRVDLS